MIKKKRLLSSKWEAGSKTWCKQKLEVYIYNFNRFVRKNNKIIEKIKKKIQSDHAWVVESDLFFKHKTSLMVLNIKYI